MRWKNVTEHLAGGGERSPDGQIGGCSGGASQRGHRPVGSRGGCALSPGSAALGSGPLTFWSTPLTGLGLGLPYREPGALHPCSLHPSEARLLPTQGGKPRAEAGAGRRHAAGPAGHRLASPGLKFPLVGCQGWMGIWKASEAPRGPDAAGLSDK